MNYTARQIGLYYKEAVRHENAAQAASIVAANLGFAGGKDATRVIRELTRE
jgi:hypothetical protein